MISYTDDEGNIVFISSDHHGQLQIVCPSCGAIFPISLIRNLVEKKCTTCGSELPLCSNGGEECQKKKKKNIPG